MNIIKQKTIVAKKYKIVFTASIFLMSIFSLFAQAAVIEKKFVATTTDFVATTADTSKYKETVQGCPTTSVTSQSHRTIANLYDDGSFELGYDENDDGDLSIIDDDIVVSGIWSYIDTAQTKIRFQPSGDLASISDGWLALDSWMNGIDSCPIDNNYEGTDHATFRILKSDMTINTSTNAGTLRLTVEGHGNTVTSSATPPKTVPKIKFDMQAKGMWE